MFRLLDGRRPNLDAPTGLATSASADELYPDWVVRPQLVPAAPRRDSLEPGVTRVGPEHLALYLFRLHLV